MQIEIQTVKQCYGIIRDNLYNENPKFDQEKMEQNLDSCLSRVNNTVSDFAKFKGDFMGISESLINKDMLSLKLDRVTK